MTDEEVKTAVINGRQLGHSHTQLHLLAYELDLEDFECPICDCEKDQ